MPSLRICIVGEQKLLEEYGALCLKKGLRVSARPNSDPSPRRASPAQRRVAGMKIVARPAKTNDLALELTNIDLKAKRENIAELDRLLSSGVPIITTAVTATLAEQSGWIRHPGRLVGIGALPSLLSGSLIEFSRTPITAEAAVTAAREFAAMIGKDAAVVRDAVGLVLPRILCALVNEACFALAEGIAPGNALDTAMKLGTNYPYGPMEWTERIGVRQVHAVMAALHRDSGEERYRVAPLLNLAALTNTSPRTLAPSPR